jgi:hypothetical protein
VLPEHVRGAGPRATILVLVGLLVGAGGLIALARVGSFETAGSFATALLATAAMGAFCWSIYVVFTRARAGAREQWLEAMTALARQLDLAVRAADPRLADDWPEASGFVRGFCVKVSVVSDGEAPLATGISVYTPDLPAGAVHALASVSKRRGVSISRPPRYASAKRPLNSEAERLLQELAAEADGVDIDVSRVLVKASRKGISWHATYDMEMDPDRLRRLIEAACHFANELPHSR